MWLVCQVCLVNVIVYHPRDEVTFHHEKMTWHVHLRRSTHDTFLECWAQLLSFSLSMAYSILVVCIVEIDETDDASSSLTLEIPEIRLEAVECCLFFFGMDGKILPGSSVRSLL